VRVIADNSAVRRHAKAVLVVDCAELDGDRDVPGGKAIIAQFLNACGNFRVTGFSDEQGIEGHGA
jgi:hypothetical protein